MSGDHGLDERRWRDARVLVGGGCGFLGSYVVPVLVDAGARVRVADNLENGTLGAIEAVRDRIEWIQGDLRDRAFAERVTAGQDVVINLAARAFGMEFSLTHHGEMLVQNLLCTLVPLDAARCNGVRHLVVVSSSCVYPDDAPVPTPELDVFTGLPEFVNEGYGWAKRMQELAGAYYAREYGLNITTVRPFNLYGANYRWRSGERAHVIPSLVKRILDGEDPLVVWGSGEQRRNFLHGRDAAQLFLKIVERSPGPGPVNLGYEEDTRIADLVALICEIAGVRPRVVFDTTKPEGQFHKSGDATRLRAITDGYVPQVSLREGIEEMIGWYRRTFADRAPSGAGGTGPRAR